jgi:hypothetical protein
MFGTNIYSRFHRRSSGGVHGVVLLNGRGRVVMNKGCRERGQTMFHSVCICYRG